MVFELQLKPLIDLQNRLSDKDTIISVSIDMDGVNVLVLHSSPQYRTADQMFAVIKADQPNNYSFIRYDLNGKELLNVYIENEYYNFHHINFLPTNEILLVCARSRYRGPKNTDQNARIYDLDGQLSRTFIVGDGIQDVRIDCQGQIWTSYFDEGIYGNYGWDNPIGTYGLICWNDRGQEIWTFKPTDGLGYISDCYAMNIDSRNNVWFYYYTGFPLVRMANLKKLNYWNPDIAGSSSINIAENKVLMAEGYDGKNFVLLELIERKLKKVRDIKFQDEKAKSLNTDHYVPCVGSLVGFQNNHKIYLTDVNELG